MTGTERLCTVQGREIKKGWESLLCNQRQNTEVSGSNQLNQTRIKSTCNLSESFIFF